MEQFLELLVIAKDMLWKGPLLILLLGVGTFLTFYFRGLQFKLLPYSLSLLFKSKEGGNGGDSEQQEGISSFQALMTALAGSIGTGNITGIAVAVAIGGYGALFWVVAASFVGMITAYSETVLAVKYRTVTDGEYSGGPMQVLHRGLGWSKTGKLFAYLCLLASLGIGASVQSNSVATGITETFGLAPVYTGIIYTLFTGMVVFGGIHTLGKVAGVVVPFMAIGYLGAGLVVLAYHWEQVPATLYLIVKSAFVGQDMVGGFLGASAYLAIQQGLANGMFANEAGLGSLSIAAASTTSKQGGHQGMLAIAGVFITTCIVCTITGLVIATSQSLGITDASGEALTGSALTIAAFRTVRPEFAYIVAISLIFFAFTTTLAWAYYGEQSAQFLFGGKFTNAYRIIYLVVIFSGVLVTPNLIWAMANLASGLMAIPNLIANLVLVKTTSRETKSYLKSLNIQ